MNTSILTIALASALLAGQNGAPTWHNDYAKARQHGLEQQKPLAIVFGSGAGGWGNVVQEARPSVDLARLLAEYVCVYVDAASPAGKKFAQEFGITGKVGVVLSDRAGSTQAFWHEGDMTSKTLAGYLQKYAEPRVSVRRTETVASSSRTSLYPPSESEVNWSGTSSAFDSYCPSCNGGGRSRR